MDGFNIDRTTEWLFGKGGSGWRGGTFFLFLPDSNFVSVYTLISLFPTYQPTYHSNQPTYLQKDQQRNKHLFTSFFNKNILFPTFFFYFLFTLLNKIILTLFLVFTSFLFLLYQLDSLLFFVSFHLFFYSPFVFDFYSIDGFIIHGYSFILFGLIYLCWILILFLLDLNTAFHMMSR